MLKKKIASIALSAALVATSLTFAPVTASAAAGVSFTKVGGDFECAYAQWSPVSGASGYNVYVKKAGGNYVQLDDYLIRQYSGYLRADAVGLAAGNYTMKVVPLVNGKESSAAETSSITVKSHVREGFSFQANKGTENGASNGCGAYTSNGTLPSNAQVIYVTDKNKDTVELDVIKDSKGSTYHCVGLAQILSYRQKGYDKTPLAIRLVGKVNPPSGVNSSGYMQIKSCYNTTIEGVGEDATIYGWGLLVRSATNIEIRNLGIMYFVDDAVSLDTDNTYCWIHNCDFFYGQPGSDSDQVKGDGSLDVKSGSNFVTMSYNHFWDSGKCSLCGMKSEDPNNFYVTYHHNWFDHSDSRHPRIRSASAHIYNNYFDGNSKYGVGMTMAGSAFVENNYFRNCKYPMLISMQGSDVADGATGTFSSENGGIIKSYNNYMTGQKRYVDYASSSSEFDAYEVSSPSQKVPSSVTCKKGGTSYNNFDTASSMYSYNAETPEAAKSTVMNYAGRVNGGDFKWTFSSADDTNYTVDSNLKAAIAKYSSPVVSIGGGSVKTNSSETTEATTKATTTTTKKTTTTTEKTTEATTKATTTTTKKATTTTEKTTEATTSSAKTWNFGSSAFSGLGTLTASKTVNGLTILATSSKTVEVKSNPLTFNGTTYSHCLALGGSGSTTYRAVKFAVNNGDKINVVLKSSGSSARTLNVVSSSGKVLGTITAGSSIGSGSYTYTGSGESVYLYSANSGINVYEVKVGGSSAVVTTKATTTTEKTTEATTKATTTTTKATTTTTKKTTTTTTSSSNAVANGTYKLNSSTLSGKACTYKNMKFNLRSVESSAVKLRSANTITFTLAAKTKVTLDPSGKGLKISGSSSKTLGTGTVSATLNAGTYTISGAASGSNTTISYIKFENA